MQTKIWKIDPSNPDKAKIAQAAKIVDAGGLVAFPTETVYGIACTVTDDALSRLGNLKNRTPDKHYTLHIGRKTDINKYVPSISLKAKKLIENALPGPLTIVFELSPADIEKQKNTLNDQIFNNLYKNNSIGIRCPADPTASLLLCAAQSPVVAPSANITSQPPAVNAQQVISQFQDQVDLIIDGGACKFQKSSTVVKINQKEIQILRPGVYSQAEIQELSLVRILFVCTGNTCRSPMAEGFLKKYLAENFQCKVDQLEQFGYKLSSAGTMGMVGLPPSSEAVTACAKRGVDIKNYPSSAISGELLRDCDLIFVMSRSHKQHIINMNPQAADKCILLAEDENIPDPIGMSQQVYDNCAEKIENAVIKRISEFLI